ncbi:MAG: hypothetical protein K8S27_12610 [Candidatus Omnitrophica bacterium]|nr:hypothetical protein [Candidatus Omnitrophota bacterium]
MKKTKLKIKESPLFWPAKMKSGVLHVLDETQIPRKIHYIKVRSAKDCVKVIHDMKTRAFGQFLVVLNAFLLELIKVKPIKKSDFKAKEKLLAKIQSIAQMLNKSRPTFPFSEVTEIIVRWAVMAIDSGLDVKQFVRKNTQGYLESVRYKRLDRVQRIADLIEDGDCILTHCNVSGELAMAAHLCKKNKKDIHFFATETRPYFQGAKLTCWELREMGANVTLIADNAIGSLMADRLVNKVIIGSDRSCANGDIANKIGSYQIACVAEAFHIPLYALTQPSDKIRNGKDIPIEIRKADELLRYEGYKIVRGDVDAFYPGFDIVPHELITKPIPISVGQDE